MGKNLLLQDACVLINLLATDRLEEIARHLAYQFAIASSVAAETIYLRRPEDKSREQADLRTHVVSGLRLRVVGQTVGLATDHVLRISLYAERGGPEIAYAEFLVQSDARAQAYFDHHPTFSKGVWPAGLIILGDWMWAVKYLEVNGERRDALGLQQAQPASAFAAASMVEISAIVLLT